MKYEPEFTQFPRGTSVDELPKLQLNADFLASLTNFFCPSDMTTSFAPKLFKVHDAKVTLLLVPKF